MGFEVSQPVTPGTDQSGAPLSAPAQDKAAQDKAAAAVGALGLRSASAPAPAETGNQPAPVKDGGMVTLATVPPLGELTISPLDDGGEAVVITEAGTEVDAETAERAREVAMAAGLKVREL